MPSASPKHKFSEDDRIFLCILRIRYANNIQDTARLFSHLNHKNLVSEGFLDGHYPESSVRSQLHECEGGRTGSQTYRKIETASHDHIRKRYGQYIDKIEDAAQALELELRLKVRQSKKASKFTRRLQRVREDSFISTPSLSSQDDDSEYEIETPTRTSRIRAPRALTGPLLSTPRRVSSQRSRNIDVDLNILESRTTNRVPPLLMVQRDMNGNKVRRHPALFFRTFQVNHGFIARRFISSSTVTSPPSFQSLEFLNQVRPHLEIDKSYASPFISLAQNPDNALKRLLPDAAFSFAIFSYDEVEADAARRYGPNTGPYLSREICIEHKIEDLPRSSNRPNTAYLCWGEFLVWGSINCEPIAVLNSAEAIRLRGIIKTIKKLDYFQGIRLGKCLERVRDSYKEVVTYKFVRSFKVPGFVKAPKSAEFQEFIKGVYDASRGDRNASILSELNEDTLISPPLNDSLHARRDEWSPDSELEATVAHRQSERRRAFTNTVIHLNRQVPNNPFWDAIDTDSEEDPIFTPRSDKASEASETEEEDDDDNKGDDENDEQEEEEEEEEYVRSTLRPGTLNLFRQQTRNFLASQDTPSHNVTTPQTPVTPVNSTSSLPARLQFLGSSIVAPPNEKDEMSIVDLTLSDDEGDIRVVSDDDNKSVIITGTSRLVRPIPALSVRSRSTRLA